MFARARAGWSLALPLSMMMAAGASAGGPPRGGHDSRGDRGGWNSGWRGGHQREGHFKTRSSFNLSINLGSALRCAPVCPAPVVIARPVCRPVIVDTCPPRPICATPVVIERPVYIERPVVVERPVVYETPIVRTAAYETPTVVRATEPRGFMPACDSTTATLYWSTGDASRAIGGLRAYISDHGDDASAKRLLGMIYLDQGRAADAVGWVYEAYNLDPSLADRAFDASAAGLSVDQIKKLERTALDHATTCNSPSAWLTVVTLLQAEGQKDLARSTIAKAVDAGLQASIVDRLRLAVGN